jgi:hypothetical protein
MIVAVFSRETVQPTGLRALPYLPQYFDYLKGEPCQITTLPLREQVARSHLGARRSWIVVLTVLIVVLTVLQYWTYWQTTLTVQHVKALGTLPCRTDFDVYISGNRTHR